MVVKRGVLIFAIACAAFAIFFSVIRPQLMISPGKPITAHTDIGDDCFACHSPFFGARANKCQECHRPADIGIRTTLGLPISREERSVALHQHLREADCMACHSDHRGVKPFRPASQFSHALLEPATRRKCAGCHTGPTDTLHQQVGDDCRQCHKSRAWVPATFDHARYFRFDRDHRTECTTCHLEADYSRYTCYGCHEHSPSNIRREHTKEGIRNFENCTECHRSADEEEAERRWKSMRQ